MLTALLNPGSRLSSSHHNGTCQSPLADPFFKSVPLRINVSPSSVLCVHSDAAGLCAVRNGITDRASTPTLPLPKTTLSFCGLKCSFQTAAGASATPRVARPSLDLVYLVFHQSLQTRRRNKEKGKKKKRRRGSGRRGGLHLTPLQPLHRALRYSRELPPFGNFSKTPVMAFEAAIKNKCFYPLLSLSFLFFCWTECSAGPDDFSSVSCMHKGAEAQTAGPKTRTVCVFHPHILDPRSIKTRWTRLIVAERLIFVFFGASILFFGEDFFELSSIRKQKAITYESGHSVPSWWNRDTCLVAWSSGT